MADGGDAGSWRPGSGRGVDLVFGGVTAASVMYLVRLFRHSWFYADDWPLAVQGRSLSGWFDPYNGHLSIVIIVGYRILLEVFGFANYLPFQALGVVSMATVAVAMYLANRSLVGPTLAAVSAVVLLWFEGMSLEPGGLNHHLVALGAVGCAWALGGSGRRSDLLVALSVTFALCSAGGGVAVAVAAVVHSLCTRAGGRRWAAVLLPAVGWGIWWIAMAWGEDKVDGRLRPGALGIVRTAWTNVRNTFDHLLLDNHSMGVVLAVCFSVYAAWRLRRGLGESVNLVAWSTGLIVWWVGLGYSRGVFAVTEVGRYSYVAVVFVVLAARPVQPVAWPVPHRLHLLRTVGSPLVVLVVAAVLVQGVRPDVRNVAKTQAVAGRIGRAQLAIIDVTGAAVGDDTVTGFRLGARPVGEIRDLLEVYGPADRVGPADLDRFLVHLLGLHVEVAGEEAAPPACRPLDRSQTFPSEVRVLLNASTDDATVEIRRFADTWVSIGSVPHGRRAVVQLPALIGDTGWELRAAGACSVTGSRGRVDLFRAEPDDRRGPP